MDPCMTAVPILLSKHLQVITVHKIENVQTRAENQLSTSATVSFTYCLMKAFAAI
uniref:Uncharacterized protein n=1 Tax=Anguilla anguilla TaxID=7936 RepID=A0A0E9WWN8_ANGAN